MPPEEDDFPGEPFGYTEWPAEIRELHERIIRAASADGGADSMKADLEHLRGLSHQTEDVAVKRAAGFALLHVLLMFLPEEMARLMFRDRGRTATEMAATILLDPNADDETQERAGRLLELMAEKFPPRGRA